MAGIADEMCVVRSMHTEAINHDPAITFFQTGAQLAGRPSMGAWLSYGLGSENRDLPAFVAMVSGEGDQPLYDRLWGSGFLPTRHQGVKFRSVGDPVLFLSDPDGVDRPTRRRFLDDLGRLNRMRLDEVGDPEIATRIAQYELAYRMQASVPELTDVSRETPRRRSNSMATTRASRGLMRSTACWRAVWRSAACGSSSCSTAAGTSIRTCRGTSARWPPPPTAPRPGWSAT
jgi:hypothetical protein